MEVTYLPSLKRTEKAKAPEKRHCLPKGKDHLTNHPFSGANMLVSWRVGLGWLIYYDLF